MKTQEFEIKIKVDTTSLVQNLKSVNKELDKIRNPKIDRFSIYAGVFLLGMLFAGLLMEFVKYLNH